MITMLNMLINRDAAILMLYTAVLSFVMAANSQPLKGDYCYFGIPFILLSNPSRLSDQRGIPTGILYRFESEENWEVQAGVVYPFENNGISFVYGYRKGKDIHKLSTGFNHRVDNFSVGSSFNLEYDAKSLSSLSLDVAAGHRKDDFSVSVVLKDIKFTDSGSVKLPSLNFIVSGPVNHFRNSVSYELSLFTNFFENKFERPYPGGAWRVRYNLERYPSLVFSCGFEFFQNADRKYETNFGFSLGMNLRRGVSVFGIQGGYKNNVYTGNGETFSSVYFNPTEEVDNIAPKVKLTYNNHERIGYYFSLSGEDDKRGTGIRDWILVISKYPSVNAEVLRIYSGGSIVPSVIYWDRRDSDGNYREEEVVYARLVATDRSNNKSFTEWIEVRD
ncbi:hypothetical protein CHISP_1316 [Chitinispirillum alkaliphilum]|nr:hypothetical protein CHISP_1316 [Chitinispirillum alkaliphilum]